MPHSIMSASLTAYFTLNLFVTLTNKQILGHCSYGCSQRPYLLTATHAAATFIGCCAARQFKIHSTTLEVRERRLLPHHLASLAWNQHAYLAVFSLFYTINIGLSNLSLTLINLSLNQTIRATAPVLTVLVSVIIMRKSMKSYCASTYFSLTLITAGVAIATRATPESSGGNVGLSSKEVQNFVGILITFLGALTAVLKTVITHKLMTSMSLKLSSPDLLQILCPYAAVQALMFAFLNNEIYFAPFRSESEISIMSNHSLDLPHGHAGTTSPGHGGIQNTPHTRVLILWMVNAGAASLLNIVSFEANKSCGPVSIAVASNLKQIVILVLPPLSAYFRRTTAEQKTSSKLVIGTFLTVIGGIWYAWSVSQKIEPRSRSLQVSEEMSGDNQNASGWRNGSEHDLKRNDQRREV